MNCEQLIAPQLAGDILDPPPVAIMDNICEFNVSPDDDPTKPPISTGNKEDLNKTDEIHNKIKQVSNGKKPLIFVIHLFNLPPGVRWRNIKNDILLPYGVPEETILHIQVIENMDSCIISLKSQEYADILIDGLDGFNYNGFFLNVKSDDEVNSEAYVFDTPIIPTLSPLIESIPINGGISSLIPFSQGVISLSSHQKLHNEIPLQPFVQNNNSTSLGPPPSFTSNYGFTPYTYVYPYYPIITDQYASPQYLSNTQGSPQGILPCHLPLSPEPTPNSQLMSNTPFSLGQNYQHTQQESFSHLYSQPSQGITSTSIPSSARSSSLFSYRQVHQYKNTGTQSSNLTSPSISSRVVGSLRQYPYQKITEIEQPPDLTRLFIGNIPYSSEWKDLKDYLRNAGCIVRVEIPSEVHGTSKGFAIATFSNKEDAKRAIQMFHGIPFQGRPLTVRYDRFPAKRATNGYPTNCELLNLAVNVNDDDGISPNKDTRSEGSVNTTRVHQDQVVDNKKYDDEARNLIDSMRALNIE